MSYGIKLHIWGEYACFTRPEMKVERVSYDVITPSAARGILEAIHWKPAIRWQIDRIHVLKPIRFESIRRNEVGSKVSFSNVRKTMNAKRAQDLCIVSDEDRQQRAATVLRDVGYVVEAHFDLTYKASADDNVGKHVDQFRRRARKGQCFHQPCMGTREFVAHFALLADEDAWPACHLSEVDRNRDLGWMLHDIDFSVGNIPRFFRAELRDGAIEVPVFQSEGVKS
jgi:CRISPR-associated protein Cas5d